MSSNLDRLGTDHNYSPRTSCPAGEFASATLVALKPVCEYPRTLAPLLSGIKNCKGQTNGKLSVAFQTD